MSRPSHFRIEPLDPAKHRREEFDCGIAVLNDYLKIRARKDMDARVTVCFVAVPEVEPGCIAGYYALSAATIVRAELPEAQVPKPLPRYPEFPATLLGRLARSMRFKGQGLGDRLMISALERAMAGASEVASWAMVTDPKDAPARRFYTQFGFQSLAGSRMFLPFKTAAKWLSPNTP
jgi:ribosomal protein S18 acetylase RimI-like enzyme